MADRSMSWLVFDFKDLVKWVGRLDLLRFSSVAFPLVSCDMVQGALLSKWLDAFGSFWLKARCEQTAERLKVFHCLWNLLTLQILDSLTLSLWRLCKKNGGHGEHAWFERCDCMRVLVQTICEAKTMSFSFCHAPSN